MYQAPLPPEYADLSREEAADRIRAAKEALGSKLVILGHHYQRDEIIEHADFRGDSYKLAKDANSRPEADFIVFCGVHFMAETAKILSPQKRVLLPDLGAGCSLADTITADQLRAWKDEHPGAVVVAYVNTSAAVKAESDICCTSGNAVHIIESLGVPEVIMIPDQFLAANVARQTGVKVITHPGACEVHERFTPLDIRQVRADYPDGVTVLAHPECPPEVVDEADYAGSTAQMINFVAEKRPKRVALITECSMSDNVAQQYPDVEFVRPCNLCPHMKRNTLAKIRHSLETMTHEVTIDPEVAERARASVERMLAVGAPPK